MDNRETSIELITSTRNPRIKNFAHLKKTRERKKQDRFIIEGNKEIERALESPYILTDVFYCPEILDPNNKKRLFDRIAKETHIFEVSREVYNHIAYRQDVEGVLGWGIPGEHSLESLQVGSNPLILVLESVEKPGNLGAILRTADAAGLDAVIITDPRTDIYNPNVVRSSVGALFSVPLAITRTEKLISWLKKRKINIYCAALSASTSYLNIDFSRPAALVMGTESEGLSDEWLKNSDQNILIPMYGKVDSMNVSVSAAILIFEAVRQRKI